MFNYLALFFSSFCGDDSCGLGSSELLVSIAAVSGNPVVLRREINLRFCVRGAEFWASGKERGVVVFGGCSADLFLACLGLCRLIFSHIILFILNMSD